ncbi:hypothetical protein [Bradyrhizobium sp. B120]|uniref:hypothetical protein n=1 Tax=Bradyrhizobium sp. B120 TaxID=3410088 RepID=UPI003B9821B2
MPRSKQFLLEQIDRAQRFAKAMNTDADRERFENMASDYRSELDAAEGAEGPSPAAAPTASEDAVPADEAVVAQPETGDSNEVAPGSTDDQEPTPN